MPPFKASGSTEPTRALIGLAILKVDWEVRHRDYSEAFVPMVVECIRTAVPDAISLKEIQESVEKRFGLTLPLNALRTVLHRAARHGYVRAQHGVYVRDVEKCSTLPFADTELRVARVHETVVSALVDFAREKHRLDWTLEAAEAAMLSFLSTSDWQLLLAVAQHKQVIPDVPSSAVGRYVVASFVYGAQTADAPLFEAIETLARGHLLASVLYLPDWGRVEQRFRGTRVYLDTTFLLFALGYAGEDRQAPCTELLGLLHEFGAELRCFDDTLEELRRILDACSNRIKYHELASAYGSAIEYFLARGLSAADIALLSATLPDALKYYRVTVEETPPYLPHYVIDEATLQEHLQAEIHYQNPQACIHDVDCVAAIMRLRRGHTYSAVETCKALFVTTNVLLAKAAKSFFADPMSQSAVPPCLTDYWLGNLLWLKNPTKAPTLPRKLIIADAYAALEPPAELWKLYLAEIAKLREGGQVTVDQYYILRHSTAARAAVMDLTKGHIPAFTEGTVAEVLTIAQEHIRADLQRQLEATTRTVGELQTKVTAKDGAIAEIDAQRRSEREALVAKIASLEERDRIRLERRTLTGRNWAHYLMFLPKGIVFTALVLALAMTFPWTLPPLRAAWPKYVSGALLFGLFIVSVVGSYWGTPIRDLLSKVEDCLAERIRSILDRLE